MTDKKPFFYRIDSNDFGAEVFSRDDKELISWVKSFALSLMTSTPKCEYSEKIIDEAQTFKEKKQKAANKRWAKNDQKEQLEEQSTCTGDALHSFAYASNNNNNSNNNSILKEYKEKSFVDWWNLYGKKGNEKRSHNLFVKLKKKDIEKCLAVVEKYVKSTPDKKYRKNGEKYLGNDCWNDEIFEYKRREIVKRDYAQETRDNYADVYRQINEPWENEK